MNPYDVREPKTPSAQESLAQSWRRCVERMHDHLAGRQPLGGLSELSRLLLDGMPLATDAHALAVARLGNVQAYIAAAEWGAAAFELRQLESAVRQRSCRSEAIS
jgi:hypothetical protein